MTNFFTQVIALNCNKVEILDEFYYSSTNLESILDR